MPCVPMARAAVAHFAVRVLPEPVNAIAEQPLIEFAPSLKLTVPVGVLPLTVAVKVTVVPAPALVSEVTMAVVLLAWLTVCESGALVIAPLFASPPSAAVTLCVPAASTLMANFAVRLLPDPASATAEQALIEVAPSLKFTVPAGDVPVTVAIKVTLVPAVDGVSEVASVVVFAEALTTCDSVELVEPALFASPL